MAGLLCQDLALVAGLREHSFAGAGLALATPPPQPGLLVEDHITDAELERKDELSASCRRSECQVLHQPLGPGLAPVR